MRTARACWISSTESWSDCTCSPRSRSRLASNCESWYSATAFATAFFCAIVAASRPCLIASISIPRAANSAASAFAFAAASAFIPAISMFHARWSSACSCLRAA